MRRNVINHALRATVFSLILISLPALSQENPALSRPYHQSPDSDGIYFVGPEVTAPVIIHAEPARNFGGMTRTDVKGVCVLQLIIGVDGNPANIGVIQGLTQEFDLAAIDAVRRSQFKPGNHGGRSVAVKIVAEVTFFTDHRPALPEIMIMERDVDPNNSNQDGQTNKQSADPSNSPPKLVHIVDAYFPIPGKKAKYQGMSKVSALITEDGIPTDVRVERGVGMGLDQNAINAVRLYRFIPGLKAGKPAPRRVTLDVPFLIY